jgi:CHAD domain-containing protein
VTDGATRSLSELGTGAELLARSLVEAVGRCAAHLPLIATEDDPEHVHQTRVGLRRARTLVGAFRPVLDPKWRKRMGAEMKALGAGFGPVRDADIALARTKEDIATLEPEDERAVADLADRMERRRTDIRARVVDRLAAEDRAARAALLGEAVRSPQPGGSSTIDEGQLLDAAEKSWRKLQTTVERLGPQPATKKLHRVRILTKRVRYVTQAVAPLLEGASAFTDEAAHLQRVLGDMNDASVTARLIERCAADAGPVIDQLVRMEHDSRERARFVWPVAWSRLSQASPFR